MSRRRWACWLAALLLAGCQLSPRQPAGDAAGTWVAAWGSAQLAQQPPPQGASAPAGARPVPAVWQEPLHDVSLRQVLRLTAEGPALRVRLSNVLGQAPLQLGGASVALVQAAAGIAGSAPLLQPGTLRAVTFGGQRTLQLAPGAEAWSDAVDLPVQRGADLAVQLHVLAGAVPATLHPGSRIASWAVAGNRVDDAAWPEAAARDGWWHLAAVDVRATRAQPVLVATGDSITDGYGVPPGSYLRWTDALARRLQAAGRTAAVVNTGIGGGRLLRDGLGPNLLSRFERDVLERSAVTHAVVLIGVNDLGVQHRGRTPTAAERAALVAQLKAGFATLAGRARERGVCLMVATVLPYGGSGYYQPQPENEADRVELNAWIRAAGLFDAVLDFDALLRDPARPAHLRAAYDNDGLHPSMDGYQAMADGFPLDFLERRCGAPAASPPANTTSPTAMPPSYDNPVLSGFASDPSVRRRGDDDDLVTSTFEYLPGLPVTAATWCTGGRWATRSRARASSASWAARVRRPSSRPPSAAKAAPRTNTASPWAVRVRPGAVRAASGQAHPEPPRTPCRAFPGPGPCRPGGDAARRLVGHAAGHPAADCSEPASPPHRPRNPARARALT